MSKYSTEIGFGQFLLLTILGAVALLLVLANVGLTLNNREVQAQANARQQFIAQTEQLRVLNQQLVEALANLAVQTDDDSIRAMLAAQGIKVRVEPQSEGTDTE